jgi:hypothetical protein
MTFEDLVVAEVTTRQASYYARPLPELESIVKELRDVLVQFATRHNVNVAELLIMQASMWQATVQMVLKDKEGQQDDKFKQRPE